MNKQKIIFLLAYVIFLAACIELSSYFSLYCLKCFKIIEYLPVSAEISRHERHFVEQFLNDKLENKLYKFDPDLGWTVSPDIATEDPAAGYAITINKLGTRSTREYNPNPPEDVLRIAVFGCSFTFCTDVADDATWPYYLEKAVPGCEVLNYGVPGYGIDQSFLRCRKEGFLAHPDVVILGIGPDTIKRNVNLYRTWLLRRGQKEVGGWWLKPRFTIKNNELKLIENPLRRKADYVKLLDSSFMADVGQEDYFFANKGYAKGMFDFLATIRLFKVLLYNFTKDKVFNETMYDREFFEKYRNLVYNPDFEEYRVMEKICDGFSEEAKKNNAMPVFLILPEKGDFRDYKKTGVPRYHTLLKYLKRKNYHYIDLLQYYPRSEAGYPPIKELCSQHYTPKGNAFVALVIRNYLKKKGIID